jgi:hypothetical protein
MWRRIARVIVSAALAVTAGSTAALPVAACSCMPFEDLREYAGDPLNQVFTGTIAMSGPAGVSVSVDRWFQGPGDRVVNFEQEGVGGQGSSCSIQPPPVGSRWLYVAFIPERGTSPVLHQCTPQARLDADDGSGAKLLAMAVATFGDGRAPTVVEPDPEPAAPVGLDMEAIPLIVGAMGIAVVALFGGLALAARRRPS